MNNSVGFLFAFFLLALNISVPPVSPAAPEVVYQEQAVDLDSSYSARSVLIFDLTTQNRIAEFHSGDVEPIASLSKIMVGFVALKRLDPGERITLSTEAVETEGEIGVFEAGEVFTFRDLLGAMMIASSNDAAMAIAEAIGERLGGKTFPERISLFVRLMNDEAMALGMEHTLFQNPTGLDRTPNKASNFSTALDLEKLIEASSKTPLLWEMSRDTEKNIYSTANRLHSLSNINILAGRIPYFIGAKTGFTDIAGESLVILYEYPFGKPTGLILLGADPGRRFIEAASLLNQVARVLP